MTQAETIESLEFDFDIMCEALNAQLVNFQVVYLGDACQNKAVWVVKLFPCCSETQNNMRFFCNECLQRKMNAKSLACQWCFYSTNDPNKAFEWIRKL